LRLAFRLGIQTRLRSLWCFLASRPHIPAFAVWFRRRSIGILFVFLSVVFQRVSHAAHLWANQMGKTALSIKELLYIKGVYKIKNIERFSFF